MGTTTHAPTDRVTCPPDHRHNTTCYRWHTCRCTLCKASIAKDSRVYRRKKAYNQPTTDLIPADTVREHVNQLRAAGMGVNRIAELADVPPHFFRSLYHSINGRPPVERVREGTADAILNILPDPKLMLRRDPKGTRRRIQALATRGWSTAALARQAGMKQQGVHVLLSVQWVTTETFERIRDLYDDLWDKEPPQETPQDKQSVTYAKRHAARLGWVPPLGWDDIDTDPRPPQVHGVNRQQMTVDERASKVRLLHRERLSDHRIAEALGIADRTVIRIRQRLGLPGWTKEQQEAAA